MATLSLLFFGWRNIIRDADRLGHFHDEMVFHQAALTLFTDGHYSSPAYPKPFTPFNSSGIVATWPGALAWSWDGDLLTSRLIVSAVRVLEILLLGTLFLRSLGFSNVVALAGAALFWRLSSLTPYAHGYIMNLGETPGAVWLGFGLLALGRWPRVAFFCWGLSVWHCKLIYLPAALALGAAYLLAGGRGRPLREFPWLLFMFLLPLLAWVTLIGIRFDLATVADWFRELVFVLVHGGSGLDGAPPVVGLAKRLASPELEWFHYEPLVKLKILTLIFVAGPASVLLSLRFRETKRVVFLSAAVTVILLFYGTWYFLWQQEMWLRHLQPALWIGFGTFAYWAGRIARLPLLRPRVAFAIVALAAIEPLTWSSQFREPLLQPGTSYARACVADPFSQVCDPG